MTVIEMRDKLREFMKSIAIHQEFCTTSKALGHLKNGVWYNKHAFETHVQMLDEISEHLHATDNMNTNFLDWLFKITSPIDMTKRDADYFRELLDRLERAVELGYGDMEY